MKFYFEEMGEVSEKNLVYIQEKFEKMKEKLPAIDADLGEVSEGGKSIVWERLSWRFCAWRSMR